MFGKEKSTKDTKNCSAELGTSNSKMTSGGRSTKSCGTRSTKNCGTKTKACHTSKREK